MTNDDNDHGLTWTLLVGFVHFISFTAWQSSWVKELLAPRQCLCPIPASQTPRDSKLACHAAMHHLRI